MSNYIIYYNSRKSMYRAMAASWKAWADSSTTITSKQIRGMSLFFKHIGKRFGLIQEFRDIGVI